jgi:hypothetical protein
MEAVVEHEQGAAGRRLELDERRALCARDSRGDGVCRRARDDGAAGVVELDSESSRRRHAGRRRGGVRRR